MDIYLSYSTKASLFNKYEIKRKHSRHKLNFIKKLISLNIFFLKKNYLNIHLITDRMGEQIFQDIKFSSIATDLENIPDEYSQLWSLPKLYAINTISNKKKPFLHIDYDFFIFKKFDEDIENSEVLLQNIEIGNLFKNYNIDDFFLRCKNKYLIDKNLVDKAYNCGIIGGRNFNFFKKYSESAIKMVECPENKSFWLEKIEEPSFRKSVLAEQYYLACFLDKENIKPTLLLKNMEDSYITNQNLGWIHFWGEYKNILYKQENLYKYLYDKYFNKY